MNPITDFNLNEHHNHEHTENCNCGHEHHKQKYHQEHGESCSCRHDHHHHEHEESCSCGHDHHHHEHEKSHHPDVSTANGIKFTCLVENLGCANCAAKMERRINELSEVNAATLTFATKQLRVAVTPEAAQNEAALIDKFQDICSSIESEVVVRRQRPSQKGKKSLQNGETDVSGKQKSHEHQIDLISIIIGTFLFATGEILENIGIGETLLPSSIFVISYLILGGQIVLTALKNLCKGQIFDENFFDEHCDHRRVCNWKFSRSRRRYAVLPHWGIF